MNFRGSSFRILYFFIQFVILSGLTNGKKSTFKLINRYKSTFHARTGQVQLFQNQEQDQLNAFNTKHSFTVNVVENVRKQRRKTLQNLLHLQDKVDYELHQRSADSTVMMTMEEPDHTDKQTILNFAYLTLNSYFEPEDKGWTPVPGWNVSSRFGWENTGIRGYLFEDELQQNLIIAIKGTSLATPVGSGPTAKLDKLNDNMMFSCCCAKAGWSWTPICSCPKPNNECSMSCLLKESNFDGSYYNLAQTIYLAVKEWFPRHTNIWMTGHSLGGALAGLVALTNELPCIAFESPGDLLYASRLGLLPKSSPDDLDQYLSNLPIYHFGNSGDPVYLGECTGVTSSCYWFDYALESQCHIGKECIYNHLQVKEDTEAEDMTPLGGSIQYHSIEYVIKNIIKPRDEVPTCLLKSNCLETECTQWTFVE